MASRRAASTASAPAMVVSAAAAAAAAAAATGAAAAAGGGGGASHSVMHVVGVTRQQHCDHGVSEGHGGSAETTVTVAAAADLGCRV
jgi:hypothetical protein